MALGVPLILKLLVAHLVGDYLVQSDRVAAGKHQGRLLVVHIGLHAGLLVLVALSEPRSVRLVLGLLSILAIHAITDAWTSRIQPRDLRLLAFDQGIHLASLVLGVAIARPEQLGTAWSVLGVWALHPEPWIVAVGGLLAVPAGATVISRWVRPFHDSLSNESRDQRLGLERAGRWIGMLERFVVYAAVLAKLEALIGFVIAVKSVLRLPEAREKWSRELAEYYLVGSLMSLSWALLAGLTVRALLARNP